MRLFAAAWPPQRVVSALAALPRPAVPGVRWVSPDRWHVTLAFLGEVAEDAVAPVERALDEAAGRVRERRPLARLGPATIRLGRAVLCVPVEGLDELASAVRAALSEAGVELAGTDLPFRGHCTIARARQGAAVPGELAGMPVAAAWRVTTLWLVRSISDPAGARYELLRKATVV